MKKTEAVEEQRKWAAEALDSWATTYEDLPANQGWTTVTRLAKLLNSTKPISSKDWEDILYHLWAKYAETIEDCEENHIDARIELRDLMRKWQINKKEFATRMLEEESYANEERNPKTEG